MCNIIKVSCLQHCVPTSVFTAAKGVQGVSCCRVQLFQLHGLLPTRLLCSWDSLRQESWRGLPCPPPGDLLDPAIESASLMSPEIGGWILYH